jgi:hypothetical protein
MANHNNWMRRDVLKAGLSTLLVPSQVDAAAGEAVAVGLVLRETAGLQRFGFPVHLLLPGDLPGQNARLLREGRPVDAQFRRVARADGRRALALDFVSGVGPLETERYVVEVGDGVEPGPEPKRAVRVEREGEAFRVTSGGSLTYTVDDRLPGPVTGVENARLSYVVPNSGGFFIRHRDDPPGRWRACTWGVDPKGRPTPASATRQGPFAASLHFEGNVDLPGAGPSATSADLTFPSSKSWVETTWRLEDRLGFVAGMRVELQLKVEPAPTLVDFGAADTVYGVLRERERMTLEAGDAPGLAGLGRPWVVRKGPDGSLAPFALASRPDSVSAEGWAHVMDESRCTALAVARFGRESRDRIEIDADGRVRICREFAGGGAAPTAGPKALACWFHFVRMPVQVGAATSAQAILAPLDVEFARDATRR